MARDPSLGRAGRGQYGEGWLKMMASGMRAAMIETGGGTGQAPARRLDEKAGYRALPVVRFFNDIAG